MARTSARSQRGQSLVELAVVIPMLLIISLGSIEFGRALYTYISITSAARGGVEYAATGPEQAEDTGGIREAVLSEADGFLNATETNPEIVVVTGNDTQGRLYAEVTVKYDFSTIFSLPGIPATINLERTVRAMVAE